MPVRDRPQMPEGYGISKEETPDMRSWQSVEDQLTVSHNYWIGTTRPDGRPHAMPVWGLWLDGAFYFGTDPESIKGRNIAHQPYITMHLESGDDVVVVEGVAELMTDPDEIKRYTDEYDAKYSVRPEGGFVVRPKVVLAWGEKDFPTSATRFRF